MAIKTCMACCFHIYSLNCRYLQLNCRCLQINCRHLQILSMWRYLQLNCRYMQLNWRYLQFSLFEGICNSIGDICKTIADICNSVNKCENGTPYERGFCLFQEGIGTSGNDDLTRFNKIAIQGTPQMAVD